jgi:hypothetical protein
LGDKGFRDYGELRKFQYHANMAAQKV